MLPKASASVKSYHVETEWISFLIKDDDLLKNIMIFGKKRSVIVLKNNFIANPSTIKIFENQNKVLHNRKIPEASFNYICWSVILIDSLLNPIQDGGTKKPPHLNQFFPCNFYKRRD